jgi:hypothetical protein
MAVARDAGVESDMKIEVLHHSNHFLVVSKEPDLIINSNDANRDSLYRRMAEQFPNLWEPDKYAVSLSK